jgi:hypothetical protein
MPRAWFIRALVMAVSLPAGLALGAAQKDKPQDKPPATYSIPLPPRPDFSPLDWLIGDWAGHTTDPTGKETQGDVHLTVSYALDKRFLLLREEVSLPAGTSAPAVHETWTGFLSADSFAAGFILRTFSSTGFITQYHVTAGDARVSFDPQGGPNPPPGFLFRRVISRLGPGFFAEKVEVAPPDSPFFAYYNARLTQVLEPKPTAPPAAAVSPAPPKAGPRGSP